MFHLNMIYNSECNENKSITRLLMSLILIGNYGNLIESKYCELDNPSGSEIEVYDRLEPLLEKLLSDALA